MHSLEILNVTKSDAGQYSIFLINSAGSAYSSARLVVKGNTDIFLAPDFLEKMETFTNGNLSICIVLFLEKAYQGKSREMGKAVVKT